VTWEATYRPLVGDAAVAAMMASIDATDGRDMLPGADERASVAVAGDQIIGNAVVADRGHTAYLWGMYVHPEHQARGVGKGLLRHAMGSPVAAPRVEASVLRSSRGAVRFYELLGFMEAGPTDLALAPGRASLPGIIMAVARDVLVKHL